MLREATLPTATLHNTHWRRKGGKEGRREGQGKYSSTNMANKWYLKQGVYLCSFVVVAPAAAYDDWEASAGHAATLAWGPVRLDHKDSGVLAPANSVHLAHTNQKH